MLVPQAQVLKSGLNRNYIPGHKKGGSVSYYAVKEQAPPFIELYRSEALRAMLNRLTKVNLLLCPDNDPHSCALYYYTEAGDHIGYHYDTSYYKGARYTILMGLLDQSKQCRLVCDLFKDVPGKQPVHRELATAPGDLVIFNGDKLWHAVTPLGAQGGADRADDGVRHESWTWAHSSGCIPISKIPSPISDYARSSSGPLPTHAHKSTH